MDTNSFIADVKAIYINKDIVEDVETRFDTLNFKLDRALLEEKSYKNNWIKRNE